MAETIGNYFNKRRIDAESSKRKIGYLSGLFVRSARLNDGEEIAEIYSQGIEELAATFETELRSERDIRGWLKDRQRRRQPVLVAVVAEEGSQERKAKHSAILGWAGVSTYRPRECYSGIGEFSIYV